MLSPRAIRLSAGGLMLAMCLSPSAIAQEERWKDPSQKKAEELYGQGRYAEALPIAQEALQAAEKTFGPEHPNVATALNDLAELYRELGKYTEAEPLIQRSLGIREKVLGSEHPEVANSLNTLAKVYLAEDKLVEAETAHRRALRIRETALGGEHPDVAQSLNGLAELYLAQGKFAEAEPLCLRALAIDERTRGAEHPDVAATLDNLASLYYYQGKYREAEPLFVRSLRIFEKALGPEHPRVALALNNLAELFRTQGRYADAEPLYQRSLRIREEKLGGEHPDVSVSLSNLALFYYSHGKYAEAEPLYQRALRIDEKVLGAEHQAVAISLHSLAALYHLQGKDKEAEPLQERAVRIFEKALGPEHPYVAQSLNNLAGIYEAQDKYTEAESLYRRALSAWEKGLGPEHPYVAAPLNNLARLYYLRGKFGEAEEFNQRALRIREKALGPEHPEVAISLNNLAALYVAQGKYAEAEPLHQRGLLIREKALGPEHPDVAISLFNIADLRVGQRRPDEAEAFFARAFDNLFSQFQYHFTYMSEKERLGFLHTVASRFPRYFSFVQEFRGQRLELTGRMYDLLLWQKGFIAGSVAALRRRIEASGDPEALALLEQLSRKRTQVTTLLSAQPENRDEWRKKIQLLEAEANELERSLVARSQLFAEEKRLERVTWREVREALQPGEAAVEFARFPFYDGKKWTDTYYYVALILTPQTTTTPAYVLLGEAKELEGAPLDDYQRLVQEQHLAPAEDTGPARAAAYGSAAAGSGRNSYAAFWQPLEKALGADTRRVYLSPDGILNRVSWAAISAPDGKALTERYDLRLLTNTKDLLRSSQTPTSRTAVLVGNPKFEVELAEQRRVARSLQPTTTTEPVLVALAAGPGTGLRSRDTLRDRSRGALSPLPGTKLEVESVSRMLQSRGWQPAIYTEARALEEVVKGVKQPRVLHLATHGFFLSDQQVKRGDRLGDGSAPSSGLEDPMLRSGLLFAGAERTVVEGRPPAGLEDGVLTAYEATGLNLKGTQLVVLSACETGLGEMQNGEGVFGLRRALQVAGAEAVLMSLWSVPDKETQELMTLFYKKWLANPSQPDAKHAALKAAQAEMRARIRSRYGRDLPFYWAAFVLVGR